MSFLERRVNLHWDSRVGIINVLAAWASLDLSKGGAGRLRKLICSLNLALFLLDESAESNESSLTSLLRETLATKEVWTACQFGFGDGRVNATVVERVLAAVTADELSTFAAGCTFIVVTIILAVEVSKPCKGEGS
jgi:hypothetical protein